MTSQIGSQMIRCANRCLPTLLMPFCKARVTTLPERFGCRARRILSVRPNAQSYQQDFTALFEAFHEHLIDVFGQNEVGAEEARVIVANLSDAAPDASGRAHWDTVQDALSGLGASLDWVEMIDPDALALAHGFNPQDLFHDGLHYSDGFSLQLADALVGALGTSAAPPSSNLLLGTSNRDEIQGTGASEIVQTFGGNDAVYAGKGADQIELGSGNDYVRVGGGEESFDGGSGHDYISYYDSRNGVRIDLRDNEVSGSWAVNDTIYGFESASGSKTGDDEMHGTAGNNTLRSYGGDDILYGRGGSDKLYGGDGRDFLDGGAGQEVDYLFGGADADRFHFDRGEGVDIIKDFQNNIDRIELDNFDFSGGFSV